MEFSFDIQGQLFPNIVTMIIQLLSTGVLLFFVRKYLFTPARNFINKRAEFAQEQITHAEQLKLEAKQLNDQARNELKDAGLTSRTLIDSAKTESAQLKEKLMKDAKREADAKLESARREIDFEKKAMRDEVSKEIIDVALAATEKLLVGKVTTDDDRVALERFIKEVKV